MQTVLGQGPSNAVILYANGGRSQTEIGGGSRDVWYEKSKHGAQYLAAHEALHLMGLDDLYQKDAKGNAIQDKYGNNIPLNKDVDPNNIMVGNGGTNISAAQIETIIRFNAPNQFGKKLREAVKAMRETGYLPSSDGRRTFDAYGSTTSHAAEWEKTWGPGGWLAVDRNH